LYLADFCNEDHYFAVHNALLCKLVSQCGLLPPVRIAKLIGKKKLNIKKNSQQFGGKMSSLTQIGKK
jgi:hypothetical protein